MLFRFCLYGFLKNQRYFEPFLYLAFLEKGLTFFEIGLLVGFRAILVNLFEVPSGTIADLWGRRASIAFCFSAYAVSFLIFGLATGLAHFFGAMFFFALGEAFRSGTHKSMIFAWLRQRGMTDQRTRIYGVTRSWSKTGSAVSVVIGAAVVYAVGDYNAVFFLAIGPCLLSVVNILGYPPELEGEKKARSLSEGFAHHRQALNEVWRTRPLRRMIAESMGFEGCFTVFKDYLQPVLEKAALALLVASAVSETRKTAVVVGVVYVILYLASASASRNAHRIAERFGGETRASRVIWLTAVVLYSVLLVGGWFELALLMVPAFLVLHVIQNFWRPILIGRIDSVGNADYGATVMSLESQGKRTGAMILAPLVGWAVDWAGQSGGAFWPLGLVGLLVSAFFLFRGRTEPPASVSVNGST